MPKRWLATWLTALTTLAAFVSSPVSAAELHREFVDGLRNKGYFEEALYFLDTLEQRTELDPALKAVLSYERGITLLKSAQSLQNVEAQDAQLDRAAGQLETFVRENPDHALAGKANAERGKILLGKARVKIWEAESPVNKDKQGTLREEARALVLQARDIFQKAHDKYKQIYDQFDTFIPQDEKEKYLARQRAEIDYMQSQIDLAMCTYEEAQTYDRLSDPYKNLLTKAAGEFEQIHQKYRSMVGGLYARMWQGKCFEEQGDIGKALGIYNEILDHGKDQASSTLRMLQNQVRHFRFICLNHRSRQDYQLVIDEAGEWLNASGNRYLSRTPTGLGIRWQKALAHDGLAEKLKAANAPAKEVEQQLRLALKEARELTGFSGEYKDVSQFMVQRLMATLNINAGDPKTFDEAFGLAKIQVKKIDEFQTEVEQAQAQKLPEAELNERREVLEGHLKQTAGTLKTALALAEPDTEPKQVNMARYLLAFVYYKLDRPLEAGVITEFMAQRFAKSDPETAMDAANIAMASWVKAYNDALERQKNIDEPDVAFELDQLLRICRTIADQWPESSLADDSRMTVGRIYTRREMPKEAADWFGRVPAGSKHYANAQINAGQAYWNAYLNSLGKPEAERPSEDELNSWQSSAQKHLEVGIKQVQQDTPSDAPVAKTTDLIAAKVTLAQIHVNQQRYDESIKLLVDKPHAPIEGIQLPGDQQRPAQGVQSKPFASLVYQLLLRSYVGKQNIDAALKAMADLEKVVGGEGGEEVTQIYVQLGRQIHKDIENTKAAGPPEKFQQVLASFDQFLNALFGKKDTMSYGSLQWMAETYLALGEILEGDAKSKEYFSRAGQIFSEILTKARTEKDPPKWIVGIQLRLADVHRSAGEFQKSLEQIEDVIAKHPNVPQVQVAAAELLQDWGASGRPDSLQYFVQAIGGRPVNGQAGALWGWRGIAERFGRILQETNRSITQLNNQLQLIYAAERTAKLQEDLELSLTGVAETEQPEVREQLQVIMDAAAATTAWTKLQEELRAAQTTEAPTPEAEEQRLATIQKLNVQIDQFVAKNEHARRTFARIEAAKKELEKLQTNQGTASEIDAAKQELRMIRDALQAPMAQVDQKPQLLQRLTALEAQAEEPRRQLLNALYNIAVSRQKYADQQSTTEAKEKALSIAKTELGNLPLFVDRDDISDERWQEFNAIYKEIQTALDPATSPVSIAVPEEVETGLAWIEQPRTKVELEPTVAVATPPKPGATESTVPQGPGTIWVILGVLVGIGVTGGTVYAMMKSQKKESIRVNYGNAPVFGPAGGKTAGTRSAKPRPARQKPAGDAPQPQQRRTAPPTKQRPPQGQPPQAQPPRRQPPTKPQGSE